MSVSSANIKNICVSIASPIKSRYLDKQWYFGATLKCEQMKYIQNRNSLSVWIRSKENDKNIEIK